MGLNLSCDILDASIHVSAPIRDSMIMDIVYCACSVGFIGYDTWVDLVILHMVDFDVILGVSWLSPYHAILDCHAKTITIVIDGISRMEWKRDCSPFPKKLISYIHARILIGGVRLT